MKKKKKKSNGVQKKDYEIKSIGLSRLMYLQGGIIGITLFAGLCVFLLPGAEWDFKITGAIGIGLLCISLFCVLVFKRKKYIACPYCDKMVLFRYDWTCDYCHNKQGRDDLQLTGKCLHCGRSLEGAICEHCGKEFTF